MMTKPNQPNAIEKSEPASRTNTIPQYNANPENADRLLLRKKRKFGGLICPPMGFTPNGMPVDGRMDETSD